VVLFLDADVLVARPFDELIERVYAEQAVAGMIAHVSPFLSPKVQINWRELFRECRFPDPPLLHEHTGWGAMFNDPAHRYCPPYFNFGVICAGRDVANEIGKHIMTYTARIREAHNTRFACQLALTATILQRRLNYICLPMRYNFANDPRLERKYAEELPYAKFLHLLRPHQTYKMKLFESDRSVRSFIERRDLTGINRAAQGVLSAIYYSGAELPESKAA